MLLITLQEMMKWCTKAQRMYWSLLGQVGVVRAKIYK